MVATALELTLIRTLHLKVPTSEGRPAHLSAASGLVIVGDNAYVVADDEYQLGVFSLKQPTQAGELIRLLAGTLPEQAQARKAAKPDFEALVRLPTFTPYPHGALLAIGSGSRATRQRAVLVPLDAQDTPLLDRQIIDLAPFYNALQATLLDLNIEGALISQQTLYLLQRGNQGKSTYSALIGVDLKMLLQAIQLQQALPAAALQTIQRCDLGQVQGVPLHFTDASVLPDGSWVFTAAAEATLDSYNDGEVVGAAIGIMSATGQIVGSYLVAGAYKIEGVAAEVVAHTVRLWLVTDADNPAIPANLLYSELSGYPFASS